MILGRVILTPPERRELKRRARGRALAVESVRRAKVILMLAGGSSYSEICARLGCTDRYNAGSAVRCPLKRSRVLMHSRILTIFLSNPLHYAYTATLSIALAARTHRHHLGCRIRTQHRNYRDAHQDVQRHITPRNQIPHEK